MLPIKVPTNFRIIAHRGASAYAPENTLPAFQLAKRMGAVEVELDVQFSKDDQIVICHDKGLDRYGYPEAKIRELTADELLSLDMGSWFSPFLFGGERMLTLDTFLNIFRDRFTYHIEIKFSETNLIPNLLDVIRDHGLQNHVIITSFHFQRLVAAKETEPDLKIGWLLREGDFTSKNIRQSESAGCYQICPIAPETTQEMVAEAHRHIAEVRTHSVKGASDIFQTIETGCDGLTVNWPDWLIHETPAMKVQR